MPVPNKGYDVHAPKVSRHIAKPSGCEKTPTLAQFIRIPILEIF